MSVWAGLSWTQMPIMKWFVEICSRFRGMGGKSLMLRQSQLVRCVEKSLCDTKRAPGCQCIFTPIRVYLLSRQIILWTDHQSLRWLLNFNDLPNQLARWKELIRNLDYKFVDRPGPKMAMLTNFYQMPTMSRCSIHDSKNSIGANDCLGSIRSQHQ